MKRIKLVWNVTSDHSLDLVRTRRIRKAFVAARNLAQEKQIEFLIWSNKDNMKARRRGKKLPVFVVRP